MENSIGSIIKRLRRERDVTQDELANALCITSQSVSKWENGLANPDVTYIPLLADFFHVPIATLFAWGDTQSTAAHPGADIERFLTQAEINLLYPASPSKKTAGKRVFIADDAEFMRTMMGRILEQDGFTVAGTATNGNEAITAADNTAFDILIMDIVMPELDGLEALKTITEAHPELYVVICSALSYPRFVAQAIQNGAARFLAKPFMPQALTDAVSPAV